MGLKLGIGWMPPQLSREVYEALGLRVVVDEAGGMHAEARVDMATIRFSQQVERYAYALREADERLRREELKNPPRGYEVTVPDPEGNPTTLGVTTHQERLERAERELAQVRRELSSSSITAITVSVMLSEVYGKTRQEAAEKLAEAMADRDKGLVFDAGDMTLSEFLNRWLDGMYGTVSHALAQPPQAVEDELVATTGLYLRVAIERDAEPDASLFSRDAQVREPDSRVPVVVRYLADPQRL